MSLIKKSVRTSSEISWRWQPSLITAEKQPLSLTNNSDEKMPADDITGLLLLPFEIMLRHMRGIVMRECETINGICNRHARAFDEAYQEQTERFKGTISNKCEEVTDGFWDKPE